MVAVTRGDIADHAGGVAVAGEVFGEVDIARPKAVDAAVSEADFRFAGEGDDVLAAGGRRASH